MMSMKTAWKSIYIRYVADDILNWCASLCTRTARHAKLKKKTISAQLFEDTSLNIHFVT